MNSEYYMYKHMYVYMHIVHYITRKKERKEEKKRIKTDNLQQPQRKGKYIYSQPQLL